jgi:hypothetical protein
MAGLPGEGYAGAFSKVVGWISQKLTLNNSKAMQDRAAAAENQRIKDEAEKAFKNRDVAATRRGVGL